MEKHQIGYTLHMASIELQESLVLRLEALARSEGVTLESYLERMAERGEKRPGRRRSLPGEEFDKLLDAEVSRGTTYQGSYPRADIYRDHN